jgi:hypothetical protein
MMPSPQDQTWVAQPDRSSGQIRSRNHRQERNYQENGYVAGNLEIKTHCVHQYSRELKRRTMFLAITIQNEAVNRPSLPNQFLPTSTKSLISKLAPLYKHLCPESIYPFAHPHLHSIYLFAHIHSKTGPSFVHLHSASVYSKLIRTSQDHYSKPQNGHHYEYPGLFAA